MVGNTFEIQSRQLTIIQTSDDVRSIPDASQAARIRVLTLLPGSDTDPIKCLLKVKLLGQPEHLFEECTLLDLGRSYISQEQD